MTGHITNAELHKLYRELAENQQNTDARLERTEAKFDKFMEEMIAFMKRSDKRAEEGSSTLPPQLNTLRIEDTPQRQQLDPVVPQDVTRQFSDRDYGIKVEVPEFSGEKGPEEFLDWLTKVERIFAYKSLPDVKKCELIITKFIGYACSWWDDVLHARFVRRLGPVTNWEVMKQILTEKFVPLNYEKVMFHKLLNLQQGNKDVDSYTLEFHKLSSRCRL